jgi:uncharacterized BrkB/YihY/UPF0761 family membrane protein
MSNQTFWAWFSEWLNALGIAVVVLAIALAILYRIFQATERTWWIWGTVFGIIPGHDWKHCGAGPDRTDL